jgi:hypothetical protein
MSATATPAPSWRRILDEYPPVTNGELPGILRDVVRYMGPIGPMFPFDWLEHLTLAFWSTQFQDVKIENLGLNLWFLGINPQGVDKNLTSDELYKLFTLVSARRSLPLSLYTSGTAEGMIKKLVEDTRRRGGGFRRLPLVAYFAEYAGTLQALRRQSGAKEALCNLYDGRDVAHQFANESVEVRDPYVVVVAATTMGAIAEHGSRGDLTNGFLSRFAIIAPDSLDIGPAAFRTEEEREAMADLIVDHLNGLTGIRRVALGPDGTNVLGHFQRRIGVGTGRVRDLDEERLNEEMPRGRLVARVKKYAALLALAQEPEYRRVEDEVLIADARLVGLAIRFVQRADAYQQRVVQWLAATRDETQVERVARLLSIERRMTAREIQQRAHLKKEEVQSALALLQADGSVRDERDGQKFVWVWIRRGRSGR